MSNSTEFPNWDASKPDESLTLIHQWATKKTQDQIEWYESRRKSKRAGSQWLRTLSIFFAAIGALCPLFDATNIVSDKILLGQWGYISIALAAAIVGYDRYFGLSTGWMRYVVTQLSIEKVLAEFQYDWIILIAQQQSQQTPQSALSLLQKLKDFSLQVDTLVKQETDAWVTEFQSNISELEKTLKAEVETRKPGGIKIKVTNARDFESVVIRLNGNHVKELRGVTEGVLDLIPPGRYEVTAVSISKKDNKEVKESKVIEVQPSLMASLELTLPSL